MKTVKLLSALVMLSIIAGCATTRTPKTRTNYLFEHSGKQWKIEGTNPAETLGINYLVLYDNEEVVFKAADNDQNGTIDEILHGNVSREEAQRVYEAGIERSRKQGMMKKRFIDRTYVFSDVNNNYRIETYNLAKGTAYNRFVITDKHHPQHKAIGIDANAYGQLNKVVKNGKEMNYYQKYYQKIMERGVKKGDIEMVNGKYLVLAK